MRKVMLTAVAAGCFFLSCKDEASVKNISIEEISFSKEGELYLLKQSGDTVQKLEIEVADDNYERETGLMYRNRMQENRGMLFIFENEQPRSFYMKNTYIPLDIIYLGADKKIVSIIKNAEPLKDNSLPSKEPAQYVLEVNAGLSEQWNLEVGDKISFQLQE